MRSKTLYLRFVLSKIKMNLISNCQKCKLFETLTNLAKVSFPASGLCSKCAARWEFHETQSTISLVQSLCGTTQRTHGSVPFSRRTQLHFCSSFPEEDFPSRKMPFPFLSSNVGKRSARMRASRQRVELKDNRSEILDSNNGRGR